jgi:hypothetical protein
MQDVHPKGLSKFLIPPAGTNYQRGCIPGPDESDASFTHRVRTRLIGHNMIDLEKIYGIRLDWIEPFLSSANLFPWEAGCTWIGRDGVRIQLHPKRLRQAHLEVLAHEAVHAIREKFDEPRFEEILAYRTSPKVWRRIFGPICKKPYEVWLFLSGSFCDALGGLFPVYPFPGCATLLISTVFLARLLWDQWRFSSCLTNLPDPRLVIALTDREIVKIARGQNFFSLDDHSLRWQVIHAMCEFFSGKTHTSREY